MQPTNEFGSFLQQLMQNSGQNHSQASGQNSQQLQQPSQPRNALAGSSEENRGFYDGMRSIIDARSRQKQQEQQSQNQGIQYDINWRNGINHDINWYDEPRQIYPGIRPRPLPQYIPQEPPWADHPAYRGDRKGWRDKSHLNHVVYGPGGRWGPGQQLPGSGNPVPASPPGNIDLYQQNVGQEPPQPRSVVDDGYRMYPSPRGWGG